jgi:hypothetical protein
MDKTELVTVEAIQYRVVLIRGQKVILDSDLAQLYQVKTKALNQAIKRNNEKFPEDFMFQLTQAEIKNLGTGNRSQIVTGSQKHRDPKSLPYAFTEYGAIMAANVLKSKRAVRMSVYVVRAFVKLRETLATHKELAQKLAELEVKIGKHDADIQTIVETIRQLMLPPEKAKRQIGFRVEEEKTKYRVKKKKDDR